jgi:hypothetical protein
MQSHFLRTLTSAVRIEPPPADLALVEFFCEVDSIALSMTQASLRQLRDQIDDALLQVPDRGGRRAPSA